MKPMNSTTTGWNSTAGSNNINNQTRWKGAQVNSTRIYLNNIGELPDNHNNDNENNNYHTDLLLNSTRELERHEFYKINYDVMTGVRIAATLSGFFIFVLLTLLYKSKCKKSISRLPSPLNVSLLPTYNNNGPDYGDHGSHGEHGGESSLGSVRNSVTRVRLDSMLEGMLSSGGGQSSSGGEDEYYMTDILYHQHQQPPQRHYYNNKYNFVSPAVMLTSPNSSDACTYEDIDDDDYDIDDIDDQQYLHKGSISGRKKSNVQLLNEGAGKMKWLKQNSIDINVILPTPNISPSGSETFTRSKQTKDLKQLQRGKPHQPAKVMKSYGGSGVGNAVATGVEKMKNIPGFYPAHHYSRAPKDPGLKRSSVAEIYRFRRDSDSLSGTSSVNNYCGGYTTCVVPPCVSQSTPAGDSILFHLENLKYVDDTSSENIITRASDEDHEYDTHSLGSDSVFGQPDTHYNYNYNRDVYNLNPPPIPLPLPGHGQGERRVSSATSGGYDDDDECKMTLTQAQAQVHHRDSFCSDFESVNDYMESHRRRSSSTQTTLSDLRQCLRISGHNSPRSGSIVSSNFSHLNVLLGTPSPCCPSSPVPQQQFQLSGHSSNGNIIQSVPNPQNTFNTLNTMNPQQKLNTTTSSLLSVQTYQPNQNLGLNLNVSPCPGSPVPNTCGSTSSSSGANSRQQHHRKKSSSSTTSNPLNYCDEKNPN